MEKTEPSIGIGTVAGFIVGFLAPLIGLIVGGCMYAAGHQTNGKRVAVFAVAMFAFWFLLIIVAGAASA